MGDIKCSMCKNTSGSFSNIGNNIMVCGNCLLFELLRLRNENKMYQKNQELYNMAYLDMKYVGELVSQNKKYVGRTKKVLSPEWRSFCEKIKYQAKSICECRAPMATGTFEVDITAITRKDVDNIHKGILDSLQGVIYKNDNQVRILRVVVSRPYDRKQPEQARIIVRQI